MIRRGRDYFYIRGNDQFNARARSRARAHQRAMRPHLALDEFIAPRIVIYLAIGAVMLVISLIQML